MTNPKPSASFFFLLKTTLSVFLISFVNIALSFLFYTQAKPPSFWTPTLSYVPPIINLASFVVSLPLIILVQQKSLQKSVLIGISAIYALIVISLVLLAPSDSSQPTITTSSLLSHFVFVFAKSLMYVVAKPLLDVFVFSSIEYAGHDASAYGFVHMFSPLAEPILFSLTNMSDSPENNKTITWILSLLSLIAFLVTILRSENVKTKTADPDRPLYTKRFFALIVFLFSIGFTKIMSENYFFAYLKAGKDGKQVFHLIGRQYRIIAALLSYLAAPLLINRFGENSVLAAGAFLSALFSLFQLFTVQSCREKLTQIINDLIKGSINPLILTGVATTLYKSISPHRLLMALFLAFGVYSLLPGTIHGLVSPSLYRHMISLEAIQTGVLIGIALFQLGIILELYTF